MLIYLPLFVLLLATSYRFLIVAVAYWVSRPESEVDLSRFERAMSVLDRPRLRLPAGREKYEHDD